MTAGLQGSVPGAAGSASPWLVGAFGWVSGLLEPVMEILNHVWPPMLVAIAAVVLMRTVRWLLLLWRGRVPRVQISNFAWATSDDNAREATWVTSLFREQLAALRLDALDPLPERAPGAPLVEIVEGVGQGVGRSLDIGKAAGRLFRSVWPDSAYEVWGTLRPRKEGGGRISVQLIERRRGNRTLLNVALEEASWEEGAREAAMAVAGALYPQVRSRDRGPWTLWKGPVPHELLADYHSARRFEEANRPEHALATYHAALDRDPLNPNLRLKIAMLQERLELDLDAWVTYEAIVDESDRRAWRGPNRRVHLLALYRLAVLLGNGRVAAQWVKGAAVGKGEGTRRDRERHERRRELMMSLECDPLFARQRLNLSSERVTLPTWAVSSRIVRSPAVGLLSLLRTIDGESATANEMLAAFSEIADDEDERKERIEAMLRILGLRHLEKLEASLRIRPRLRGWREWWIRRPSPRQWFSSPEFARSVVRTSKLLVRLRIAASLEGQVNRTGSTPASSGDTGRWIAEIREAHQILTRRWPFPPAGAWRAAIHFLAPRRRWANRREDAWQLHYNAACATATVLRTDSALRRFEREASEAADRAALEKDLKRLRPLPATIGRKQVIERAIAQLEEYAFRAGSRRVAAQADWLAIDDPDLRGLRKTSEFQLWASHHLPRQLPLDLPSRKADVKRFTVRVVHEGARVFAESWMQRADRVQGVDGARPASAEIAGWWGFEAQVWAALANAFREHLSWQERLSWLRTLQDWLGIDDIEEQVDFSHEARGTAAADSVTEDLFDVVARLAAGGEHGDPSTVGPPPFEGIVGWVDERSAHVRRAYERGENRANHEGALRAERERDEALRAGRIWSRLAELLEPELNGAGAGGSIEDLGTRIDRVRSELPAS